MFVQQLSSDPEKSAQTDPDLETWHHQLVKGWNQNFFTSLNKAEDGEFPSSETKKVQKTLRLPKYLLNVIIITNIHSYMDGGAVLLTAADII